MATACATQETDVGFMFRKNGYTVARVTLTTLFSFVVAFRCHGDNLAVFENQTEAPATIKVLGTETKQIQLMPKAKEKLNLKGGEYYFKVRFDLSPGPKYGVGPYFDLVDDFLLKHDVTVPLQSPPLAGLYQISKEQFESESEDAILLKKANSVPKAWVRWASIVLTLVSEKQDKTARMMFRVLAQREKERLTSKDYQALNVGSFAGGTKVSIRDIIKQHGKPSERRTVKRSVNTQTKEEVEFDVYSFDLIELQCRKGADDVEWLNAPTMWFIEGIRKKAQRALERTR